MDYLLKMMIFHGYVSHNQMAMGFICALVMTGISICGMTRLHPMNPMARTSETRAVLKPAPGVKKNERPVETVESALLEYLGIYHGFGDDGHPPAAKIKNEGNR